MKTMVEHFADTIEQAKACGQDGSAHEEWLTARDINQPEAMLLETAVATGQLPLGQFFRVAFEYGYSMGFNHKNQIGLELDDGDS